MPEAVLFSRERVRGSDTSERGLLLEWATESYDLKHGFVIKRAPYEIVVEEVIRRMCSDINTPRWCAQNSCTIATAWIILSYSENRHYFGIKMNCCASPTSAF